MVYLHYDYWVEDGRESEKEDSRHSTPICHLSSYQSFLTLGAHAQRGLQYIVVLCVYDYSRTTGYEAAYERYQQLQCYKGKKRGLHFSAFHFIVHLTIISSPFLPLPLLPTDKPITRLITITIISISCTFSLFVVQGVFGIYKPLLTFRCTSLLLLLLVLYTNSVITKVVHTRT